MFVSWLSELKLLKGIELPRNIGPGSLTIHVFSDASGAGYAAVVLARVEYEGKVKVQLLSARSRIAPKNATIPRLELTAASIGARLAKATMESLTRQINEVTYWTDSSTVLAWIDRDIQWGSYVINRVKEIRAFSAKENWRYVPSEFYPADLPSRGCTPLKLLDSQWWLGPKWLHEKEDQWPVLRGSVNESEVISEVTKSTTIQMINTEHSELLFSNYFSEYSKLV